MPTTYIRKGSSTRGEWNEDNLKNAIKAVEEKSMGVNEAAKFFSIPKTTLKRRIKTRNFTKSALGPSSVLGCDNEKKIVLHIQKLQNLGFSPSRDSVRYMAYELAEKLKIPHTFNKEAKKAGYDWLQSFLARNQKLSIRKAEGVSVARAKGMNKETVYNYFKLLEGVLKEYDLFENPLCIFNMDETGLQLNNKPGEVVAIKGSKNVASIISGERGETISILACCNGEGTFLPPYCIFKGKNIKHEFSDGMPPGAQIKMSPQSAYVNSDIFLDWLKNHFTPRKPIGKVLLILDGHASHTSSLEMLEYAEENNIILLSLPPHTTHWLQPLDRSFFKSLKANYYAACNNFLKNNPSRKINRLQFGNLLNSAWVKSASAENGISGFRACGIIPFNPDVIPHYAYLSEEDETEISVDLAQTPTKENEKTQLTESRSVVKITDSEIDPAVPSTSKQSTSESFTPTKLLEQISPLPNVNKEKPLKRKSETVATILSSAENILKVKKKKEEKLKKEKIKNQKQKKIGSKKDFAKSKKAKETKKKKTLKKA